MKGINNLAGVFRDIQVAARLDSLPQTRLTPSPTRGKVAGKTDRRPVNRQAALVIAPAPWWARPFPATPPGSESPAEKQLKAQIKILQNERGEASAEIGRLRVLLKEAAGKLRAESDRRKELENRVNVLSENVARLLLWKSLNA